MHNFIQNKSQPDIKPKVQYIRHTNRKARPTKFKDVLTLNTVISVIPFVISSNQVKWQVIC